MGLDPLNGDTLLSILRSEQAELYQGKGNAVTIAASILRILKRYRWGWLMLLAVWIATAVMVASPAMALPQGDAIRDSRSLLRRALPLTEASLTDLDQAVVSLEKDFKYNHWSAIRGNISKVEQRLDQEQRRLLDKLDPQAQALAAAAAADMREHLEAMAETSRLKTRGKSQLRQEFEQVLIDLERFERNWVGSFPYQVPAEYTDLPQLLGRAEVELETTQGTMILTLDGYSAPVTAGNFADLVQKGFYDDIGLDRVEDFYLIQAGDPPGEVDGYVDPEQGTIRRIPMEIRVLGQQQPYYGDTLANLGYWDADPVLPFSAPGAVAMAPYPEDPNSASSQFFIFIAEPDLTPAGLNLMDGRYAVFGYVTEGLEVMYKLKPDDRILRARLLTGADKLKA